MENQSLPEKWCILITNENIEVIGNWRNDGAIIPIIRCSNDRYAHSYFCGKKGYIRYSIAPGYTEITFDEFKKFILKQPIMEKKLIGYKLSGLATAEEISKLLHCKAELYEDGRFFKELQCSAIKKAEKLGILNTWFVPVYLELNFKAGDYVKFINASGWGVYPTYSNSIGLITKIHENRDDISISGNIFKYGEITEKEKFNRVAIYNSHDVLLFRLATTEEIELAARENRLSEAKSKYPIGTKFYPAHVTEAERDNKYCIIDTETFNVSNDDSIVAISKNGNPWEYATDKEFGNTSYNRVVYSDGVWAKIKENVAPSITINGYTGEFFDDYVKFGCANIDKAVFISMYNVFFRPDSICEDVNSNKKIKSLTIGDGNFSKDDIIDIATYYLIKSNH